MIPNWYCAMVEKRLFIGNLKHGVEECLADLEQRFKAFGEYVGSGQDVFERHNGFAFVTMRFEDAEALQRLKSRFHKVKFKGNQLIVDYARPAWSQERESQQREEQKQSRVLEKRQRKNDWEHYKKMEHINASWRDLKEVVPGRMRESPRSRQGLRNITFRLNVGGALKVYKCYKTKLWGYERDKDTRDLVHKFSNHRFWKDGSDHVVERLDYSRSRGALRWANMDEEWRPYLELRNRRRPATAAGVAGEALDSSGSTLATSTVDDLVDADESDIEQEKERTNNILAQMMDSFDFAKPMALDDEDAGKLPDAEQNRSSAKDNRNYKSETAPENADYYQDEETVAEEAAQADGDDSEEFIPTFGANTSNNGNEQDTRKVIEGTISNTDTLRTLFNPEVTGEASGIEAAGATFKLINDGDQDIDQSKNPELAVEDVQVQEEVPVAETHTKQRRNLFFPHFESPFLQGQTQLSKIQAGQQVDLLQTWSDDFWANRGLWMKEMKQKKRDALRKLRKRKGGDHNVFLL